MEKEKDPKKVKQGLANKRAGYRTERELEKLLLDYGFNAKRVAMSGALSSKNLIGSGTQTFQGDLHIYGKNKTYILESKKRSNLDGLYNLYSKHGSGFMLHDSGIYVVDIEDLYYSIESNKCISGTLLNKKTPKYLINWFSQDNSDIVAIKMNHKPFLFIIKSEENNNGRSY